VPYFVIKKNKKTNELVVAKGSSNVNLFNKELIANKFNWISNERIKLPLNCYARIRYRQPLQRCRVTKKNGIYSITFTKPQRAITPGQFIVLYSRRKMLGGGVIN
jgi:tRNA-uridine 2-sulfurtransferase